METFMEATTCFLKKLLVMHVQLQYLLSVDLGSEMAERERGVTCRLFSFACNRPDSMKPITDFLSE